MRFYSLINTLSGAKEGAELHAALLGLKKRKILDGEIVELSKESSEGLTSRLEGFDAVLLGGGDGTVSRLLPELLLLNIPVALLPLGVGNDLARELLLPTPLRLERLETELQRFELGKTVEIDVCSLECGPNLEHRVLFINYLSIGFEASVVKIFHEIRYKCPWLAQIFGRLGCRCGYFVAGLLSVRDSLPEGVEISARGKPVRIQAGGSRTIIIANIKSYCGLGRSNQIGVPSDGRLECIKIRSLFEYPKILTGSLKPIMESSEGYEITSLPDRLDIQVDGETYQNLPGKRLRVKVLGKVKFLVPKG